MSDEDLRALERRAKATGSGEDILAYFRAFIRTVSLPNRPMTENPESRRLVLRDGSAEPLSSSNEVALRCLHGYLQVSENGGAWTSIHGDRPGARPVARTPDVSLEGIDPVSMQVNAITRSLRDLLHELTSAGLIYGVD